MSRPLSRKYASLWLITICILSAGFFSACSSGGDSAQQQPDYPDGMPPGTGGVSFRLVWQQTPLSGAKAQFTPPFDACVDRGIGTIAAAVTSGTATVSSNSWPCSLHGGVLLGVPAGTNYTLHVSGISTGATPTTTWAGSSLPLTVVAGEVTSAGVIGMNYIGVDTVNPTVTSISSKSNPASTTNLPATDRIIISFDEPMAISSVTTTNISLTLNSSPVAGSVRYDAANNAASFIPSSPLAYDSQYVLQVISCASGTTDCITDMSNHALASNATNTFITESAPAGVPAAPSNVTAAPGNGQVTLDWLASNGAATYSIYYLASAGVTTTNGTLIADAQAPFVHLGLANAATTYYIVTAVNSFGESLASAEVSTTPVFPAGNPSPPASVTVDSVIGQNTVTWPAVAGATSYNLYWSTTPITPDRTVADNVVRDATSPYLHTGTTAGLTYCYVVTAINALGESADSMQACGGIGLGSIQVTW